MPYVRTISYETRLMVLLSLGFGFVFLDRNAFSYLAPFIAPELKLNNTQIGVLAAALSCTWALSGILIGRWSDSSGKRKSLLVIAFIVFSACSFVSGLTQSFLALLGARLLMGISEGPICPISQSLLVLESSEARRGLNMGIMQNFGSNFIGNCIAPLALVALATHYGWRMAFFIAAIPGFITAALIAKWVREPNSSEGAASARVTAPSTTDRAGLLKHRNIWLCMLISCLMVAWMVLAWAFLPLFFINVRKFSATDMSLLMSGLGLSAALCAFLVPWLSDRMGRKPVMIVFCLLGALTPLASLYYEGSLPVLAVFILIGWSASGVFPLFMATVPSETLPPTMIATAMGLVMGTGEILGGFIGPTVAGWAADVYGLQTPLLIEVACALAATVLAVFLRETAPAKARRTASVSEVALT